MLGIDVSKDTLHCTLLNPQTRTARWCRIYPNTPQGVARLLKATQPDCPWALEPTGAYSTAVVRQARLAGRDVRLAEPRKAKRFLQSRQNRAKCDRLDSEGLGLFALSQELPPYPVKSALVDHLSQLLSARKGLARSLQQLQAQARSLPQAAPTLQPAIDAVVQQQAQLDLQIKTLFQQAQDSTSSQQATLHDWIRELQRVPGIGPVTAATVASRLADRHFPRSDAFVAYCGLDVTIRQSGHKNGNLGLTKQGDAELRRLFYLAAQANLRVKESPFRDQYQRELEKGLSSTAALCAVARKLARLAWAIVHHGTSYDPERVYQQPLSSKEKYS